MSEFIGDIASEILGAYASKTIRTATPFIVHGVSAGLSANSILSSLQAGGLGVRRSTGLNMIRNLRKQYGAPGLVKGVKPGLFPEPERYGIAAYPTKRKFTYVMKVTGYNPVTGLSDVQHVNVVSDDTLTLAELEETAIDLTSEGQSAGTLFPESAMVEKVLVSPLIGQ